MGISIVSRSVSSSKGSKYSKYFKSKRVAEKGLVCAVNEVYIVVRIGPLITNLQWEEIRWLPLKAPFVLRVGGRGQQDTQHQHRDYEAHPLRYHKAA